MINIRVANESDAEALLNIYKYYIEETAITFEYDVPTVEEFRSRIRNTLKKYPYLVAEVDEAVEAEDNSADQNAASCGMKHIVGYAYASAFKERAAYDWSVELSIYVENGGLRGGVGKALYAELEPLLVKQGITNVNACIAYPEVEDEYLTKNSVEYHEHMGYSMVGKFHKCAYKFGRWYDMVWMEKMIAEHTEKPEPFKTFPEISKLN